MIKKQKNEVFLFVDTETGGVDPNKHSLLSIGLCLWSVREGIIDKTELFIKHNEYIVTKKAQSINKFELEKHNELAIEPKEAIKKLLDFCYNYINPDIAIPIIGHNVQFDIGFLKKLFMDSGRSFNQYFSYRYIDTYSVFKTCVLAGIIEKEINSSSDAFSYFNIKVDGRHSALGDCIATVELYEKLLQLIKNK